MGEAQAQAGIAAGQPEVADECEFQSTSQRPPVDDRRTYLASAQIFVELSHHSFSVTSLENDVYAP